MTAITAAHVAAQRSNLRRYCQLLATDLTAHEREHLHRLIAETRLALDRFGREPGALFQQDERGTLNRHDCGRALMHSGRCQGAVEHLDPV